MSYKNAIIYKFTQPVNDFIKALNEKIVEKPFVPCGKTQSSSEGFVPPYDRDGVEDLTQTVMGFTTFRLRNQIRVLPAGIVNERVQERVKEIEEKEDCVVYSKRKMEIKEDVIATMLPNAFLKSVDTCGYIDTTRGLLVINAGSRIKAEKIMAVLRGTVGSLPVIPLNVSIDPSITFTGWLRDDNLLEGFELGHYCELYSKGVKGTGAVYKNQDLTSEEITANLDAGKRACALALKSEENGMKFKFNSDLDLKGIDLGEEIKAEIMDAEDQKARFDADLTLCSTALGRTYDALGKVLGGWVEQRAMDLGDSQEQANSTEAKATQANSEMNEDQESEDSVDALYDDAKRIVINTRKASISSLQRKLRIGYNRTARLIESLEAQGVVSEPGHNGRREVLLIQ